MLIAFSLFVTRHYPYFMFEAIAIFLRDFLSAILAGLDFWLARRHGFVYIQHRGDGPAVDRLPGYRRRRNTPEESLRARRRWRQLVQYTARILRIRRRYARLGQYLNQERIQDLVSGVVRNRGVLRRVAPAATRQQLAQATERVRRRRNNGL